jgi:hypothetical protein
MLGLFRIVVGYPPGGMRLHSSDVRFYPNIRYRSARFLRTVRANFGTIHPDFIGYMMFLGEQA